MYSIKGTHFQRFKFHAKYLSNKFFFIRKENVITLICELFFLKYVKTFPNIIYICHFSVDSFVKKKVY